MDGYREKKVTQTEIKREKREMWRNRQTQTASLNGMKDWSCERDMDINTGNSFSALLS